MHIYALYEPYTLLDVNNVQGFVNVSQKGATWKIKKKMANMKICCSELCFITGFEDLGLEAELVSALSTEHD